MENRTNYQRIPGSTVNCLLFDRLTPPCINISMVGLLVKGDLRSVGLCWRFLGSLQEVVTIYPYTNLLIADSMNSMGFQVGQLVN